MGVRATKHQTGNNTDQGSNNLVTRFTISDESGPSLSIDQVFRVTWEYHAYKIKFYTSYFFAKLETSESVVESGTHLNWHWNFSVGGTDRIQTWDRPIPKSACILCTRESDMWHGTFNQTSWSIYTQKIFNPHHTLATVLLLFTLSGSE